MNGENSVRLGFCESGDSSACVPGGRGSAGETPTVYIPGKYLPTPPVKRSADIGANTLRL